MPRCAVATPNWPRPMSACIPRCAQAEGGLRMLEGCTPWPQELAAHYRRSGLWEGISVAALVERTARQLPDKVAVVSGDQRISYAQLIEDSLRLAAGFSAAGIAPGDRV